MALMRLALSAAKQSHSNAPEAVLWLEHSFGNGAFKVVNAERGRIRMTRLTRTAGLTHACRFLSPKICRIFHCERAWMLPLGSLMVASGQGDNAGIGAP